MAGGPCNSPIFGHVLVHTHVRQETHQAGRDADWFSLTWFNQCATLQLGGFHASDAYAPAHARKLLLCKSSSYIYPCPRPPHIIVLQSSSPRLRTHNILSPLWPAADRRVTLCAHWAYSRFDCSPNLTVHQHTYRKHAASPPGQGAHCSSDATACAAIASSCSCICRSITTSCDSPTSRACTTSGF